MRYWRNCSAAATERSCTSDHWRLTCHTTSHTRPAMTAIAPTALTTMASHRGTRWRSIHRKAGQSSAVMRIATSSGMTRSFSWMTSQTPTPRAAAMTSRRHA